MTKYVLRGDALEPAYVNNLAVCLRGWGVLNGLVVSEPSPLSRSVKVSAGSALINGQVVTITDGTVVSLTTSPATHDRYDMIVLNSSGILSAIDGAYPAAPAYATDYDFDANDAILLAEVYVPAGTTVITDSLITNMAIEAPDFASIMQTYYNTLFEKGASDDLQISNDGAEFTVKNTGYGEVKTIMITVPFSGTLRVKFDMASNASGYAVYGKIYKNGVAVGTEQSTSSETYTTYSEDIDFGDIAVGDTIELYAYNPNGVGGLYRNFRLYCENTATLVNTNVLSGEVV